MPQLDYDQQQAWRAMKPAVMLAGGLVGGLRVKQWASAPMRTVRTRTKRSENAIKRENAALRRVLKHA